MKRMYFVYQNKTYYVGTQIVVLHFNYTIGKMVETRASFVSHDTDKNIYAFQIGNCTYYYPKKKFDDIFIGIGDNVIDQRKYLELCAKSCNQIATKHTFSEEVHVPGMLIAWMWYVFIMIVSTLFYARVGLWILTSVVFFVYRYKKLMEVGL